MNCVRFKRHEFTQPARAPLRVRYMGGGIRGLTPELAPTVGAAFTAELDSSTPGKTADTSLFWEQMERSEEPVIWVVKAVGSRPDHECIMGDGMAKSLYASGCIGAITDGGVRDVAGVRAVPFAVHGKGTTIHHAALRFVSTGEPVEGGGLTVRQGDILHAGADLLIRDGFVKPHIQ